MRVPNAVISPAVDSPNRAIIYRVVVLTHLKGPRKVVHSPLYILKIDIVVGTRLAAPRRLLFP